MPLLGMIALTIGIALWMLKLRYRAVRQDGVNPRYFQLNRGAKLPDYLIRVTQHYDNLFETPLLFYTALILVVILKELDWVYVVLAWAYFISRLIHAYIHTTHNKLGHRRNIFLLSSALLIIIWIKLAVDIVQP